MNTHRRQQQGTTTVEFAICGVVLLMLMFALIEFGRVLFTLQVLEEGARRAARVATVCAIGNGAIGAAATFVSLPGSAPTVTVQYLNAAGAPIADTNAGYAQIRSVRVSIAGYSMPLAIPFLNLAFDAPTFTSTLPRESLGVPATGAAPAC